MSTTPKIGRTLHPPAFAWNYDHLDEVPLHPIIARHFDRRSTTYWNRIFFALLSLKMYLWTVEPARADWRSPEIIRSVGKSAFAKLLNTGSRAWVSAERAFPDEPYAFKFKGCPSLIDAVFQGVGLATTINRDKHDFDSVQVVRVATPEIIGVSVPIAVRP